MMYHQKNLCHQLLSLENMWRMDHQPIHISITEFGGYGRTDHWPVHVITFLLVTQMNVVLTLKHWVYQYLEMPIHTEFCSQLAQMFIDNNEFKGKKEMLQESIGRERNEHKHAIAPINVSNLNGQKWDCKTKAKYQKYKCQEANHTKYVRTYCKCTLSEWICASCHLEHTVKCDSGE